MSKYQVECIGGRYDGHNDFWFDELPYFIKVMRSHKTDLGGGGLFIDGKEVAQVTSAKATEQTEPEYYEQYKMVRPNYYKYKVIPKKDYERRIKERRK